MVFSLVCSGVIAAATVSEVPDAPLVPWFVPRSAALGVFINSPMVTPHFRLAWEGAILSQPRNDLIWIFTLGSGVGVGAPTPMASHQQHVVLAGFGYRSDHPVIHWGFHVASGILYYRATFLPGANAEESRALGYIEGRLQFGVRITPHFRLAAYFGYASPFVFNPQRFPGNTYVGGVDTGIVIDWR